MRVTLAEAKKKADEGVLQQMEDVKKKLQRELEGVQKALGEAEVARDRAERSKRKLQQEVRRFMHFDDCILSMILCIIDCDSCIFWTNDILMLTVMMGQLMLAVKKLSRMTLFNFSAVYFLTGGRR